MYFAKAMYEIDIHTQKTRIVCADEEYLNYNSYYFKGLRCLECNAEVFLRAGYDKRIHFAHYPAVNPVERKCSLRITANNSKAWKSLTSEGKGQRKVLFQEYFINMVKNQDKDFDNNIQIVKDRLPSSFLDDFVGNCCTYFYTIKNSLIEDCQIIEKSENSNDSLNG
jgi:hypothetical protein